MVHERYSAARMANEYEALFRTLTGKEKTDTTEQGEVS